MNIMHSNDAHTNLHAIVIGCYMITMRHLLALQQMYHSGFALSIISFYVNL